MNSSWHSTQQSSAPQPDHSLRMAAGSPFHRIRPWSKIRVVSQSEDRGSVKLPEGQKNTTRKAMIPAGQLISISVLYIGTRSALPGTVTAVLTAANRCTIPALFTAYRWRFIARPDLLWCRRNGGNQRLDVLGIYIGPILFCCFSWRMLGKNHPYCQRKNV